MHYIVQYARTFLYVYLTAFEKPYVYDVHDIGQRAQVVTCQWEYFSISCILHEILLNHRIKKKKTTKKNREKTKI